MWAGVEVSRSDGFGLCSVYENCYIINMEQSKSMHAFVISPCHPLIHVDDKDRLKSHVGIHMHLDVQPDLERGHQFDLSLSLSVDAKKVFVCWKT